jgi:hypothetical protein
MMQADLERLHKYMLEIEGVERLRSTISSSQLHEGRYRRVRLKSLKSIVTEGAGELTWDVETRLAGWACEIRTQKRRRKLSV